MSIRIRINIAAHLYAVERQLGRCTLHADNSSKLCHTICINDRQTMRKIEQQMCDAIRDNKDWKSGNTQVITLNAMGSFASFVYLHGNHIATITDDSVRVYDGGWQSNTTKSRLNAICDAFCIAGEGVYQENFEWFVRKFVGNAGTTKVYNAEPFVNGYTFA